MVDLPLLYLMPSLCIVFTSTYMQFGTEKKLIGHITVVYIVAMPLI